jgi:hypothetical protein
VLSAGSVGSLLSAGAKNAVIGNPADRRQRKLDALLVVALGAALAALLLRQQ